MSSNFSHKWQVPVNCKINNVQRLLSSLQNHILAHYTNSYKQIEIGRQDDILTTHLSHLFSVAINILISAANILAKYPSSLELLYNILLESVTGGMLFKILNSLLLMPTSYLTKIHHLIQDLLEPLDKFTQLLPCELLMDSEKDSSSE